MSHQKFATAADRQRAYRQRHRNAIGSNVTQIGVTPRRVTKDPRDNDVHYQFICVLDGERIFAGVICGSDNCDKCRGKAVRS